MEIYLSLFILFVFIIFYRFNIIIANLLNLFEKNKVPLLGGVLLSIGVLLNNFYITNNNLETIYLVNTIFLILIFVIGFLDDKYDLNPVLRIIFMIILITFFIIYDGTYIQTLNFKYFGFYYFSENNFIRVILPIFCIIVFINAFNFTDGINGLAGLLGLSWFIYFAIKYTFVINLYLIFVIFLIFFLVLNFQNKSFLGDSGNYIISSIIGYLLILINKNIPFSIYVEEILLLLLIPGIDLIRLFFVRIKNKQNPLEGDFNHFHHILTKKLGLLKSLVIYLSLVNLPIYIFLIYEEVLFFLIILSISIYYYLINKFSKK